MSAPEPTLASPANDAIARRAAEYFQRRRFWDWSDLDQAEFEAWCAESALHRAAYLRVEGIAAHTRRLAAHRAPRPAADAAGGKRKIVQRRFVLPLLAAASVVALAALGIPLVSRLMTEPPDRTYSTDIGGRTLLTFADRTQIELNTSTVVRFHMTGEERTVWLERGEAWFHVSHDASRPFAVVVGRHRVTDLGTEFLVRRGADGMEVALLTGRATLSTEGAPTALLVPGDEAVATPGSMSVVRKTPEQLADELAWRRGVLVFRNTRLADVVREFNRYNETKLVIADPSIADLKFSAAVETNRYEDFLHLAETVLNLRVEREGNDILISRAARKPGRRAP